APAAFVESGVEVRATDSALTAGGTLDGAINALLAALPDDGYLSIQCYLDRVHLAEAVNLRDLLAARIDRPATFGWGPRFLHSTGQFHKGGPAVGVFLQITAEESRDIPIPDRPFTFGELIRAQAQGDATVLAQNGRPVLTLNLTDPAQGLATVLSLAGRRG
ncbi:MAG TPA: glucose-6-phosphate isomerase, partial [Terrimesophilobacter sp.]|nr:glucose-6-phosphate isomerase [Terrimesophilobacter sp.]